MQKIIAPSILAADFWHLGDAIEKAVAGGAAWVHVDVMDGHFVPNLTFGPCIVESIRKHTSAFVDAHLMIDDPVAYAEPFVKAGASNVTFHVEIVEDCEGLIDKIHDLGAMAGVSIKPNTPVSAIEPLLDKLDLVLVMTVEPGFSYQKMIPECVDKVRRIRELAGESLHIQVDGGINKDTIATVAAAGANVAVAGGGVYAQDDIAAAAADLARCLEANYQKIGG